VTAVRPLLLGGGAVFLGLLAASLPGSAADLPREAERAIVVAEDERRWDQDLRTLLRAREPAVRARTVLAIGRFQDSTTVEALRPLLADPEAEVRREVVFALGQIGHRSAREALEGALQDRDAEVVQLSIEALGKLADKVATAKILPYLQHASAALRRETAVALWRLADSTALEHLVSRHADSDAEVRWRVLYALEKIVQPQRVVLIAAHHLDDPDVRARAYAARTLGRQKSPRAVAYLLQAVHDSDVGVAVNALRGLQLIGDSTCTRCAPTLAVMLGHPHPYVRATAAAALGDRFALIAADSVVRAAAIESLTSRLSDPDPATRAASARALIRQRGEAGFQRARLLLSDSSIYVRVALLEALEGLPPALIEQVLQPRLTSATTPLYERMAAHQALTALGRVPVAVQTLRRGLQGDAMVVAVSASALAELRDTTSVKMLSEAYGRYAKAADPDARNALRDALRELAGRAFADSLERIHRVAEARRVPAEELLAPVAVRGAVLRTTRGEIEWSFFGNEAPQTVKNFVRLAERGYFNGLAMHRVVPNFVIQDGDPTGTGWGGPGYTIRCEYNRLRYDPGMVGMALSGKDTGGSQWFITHSTQPHLDGRYTIFARVTRGMDVVGRIVQGDRVLSVELVK
jgi:cyclophilin family peptidyl-prolyl cis-trans isomerase/HEAT repeat protein